MKNEHIFLDVARERARQDEKFGEQNRDFGSWLEIFQEELGEACRARMEARYNPGHVFDPAMAYPGNWIGSVQEQRAHFRKELVESIAVLVAAVECGERNGWFE